MFWKRKERLSLDAVARILEMAAQLVEVGAETRAPIKFMHDDESEDPLLGPEDVAFAVSGPDYGDDEDDEG